MEEKQPKHYGSHYMVHEDGRIFGLSRKPPYEWVLLNQTKWQGDPNSYYRVSIDGRQESVHRIVAKCFCPNPHGHREVNHIDGNKWNNHASNLEWCSRIENVRHAFRTGLITAEKLALNAKKAGASRRALSPLYAHAIKILISIGFKDYEIRDFLRVPKQQVLAIRHKRTYRDIPWD